MPFIFLRCFIKPSFHPSRDGYLNLGTHRHVDPH